MNLTNGLRFAFYDKNRDLSKLDVYFDIPFR